MNDLEKTVFELSERYERTLLQKILRRPPPIVHLSDIEKMGYGMYRPVATSWPNSGQTIVILRELTETQIYAIGDISMIKTFWDKMSSQREQSVEEMSAYAERHDQLLRLSMANPTYDEVIKMAGIYIDRASIDAELRVIKDEWKKLPSGQEKAKLKKIKLSFLGKLLFLY
jgi:hypothetical protein